MNFSRWYLFSNIAWEVIATSWHHDSIISATLEDSNLKGTERSIWMLIPLIQLLSSLFKAGVFMAFISKRERGCVLLKSMVEIAVEA